MKQSVLEELRRFSEEFYAWVAQFLTQRREIVLKMKEKLRKIISTFYRTYP